MTMASIKPLKPAPLKAAIAAFMDVDVSAITLAHETGSLRKAVARAIRAYAREARNDNEPQWPTSG